MPSRRQQRVNARLIQDVSTILRELKDKRIGFVTVTRCDISPDMRVARIYVSVLGDDEERAQTMQVLEASAKFVRRELGKVMQMKMTPEIIFRRERYVAEADEMSRLITAARMTDPNPGPRPEDENTPEEDTTGNDYFFTPKITRSENDSDEENFDREDIGDYDDDEDDFEDDEDFDDDDPEDDEDRH